LSSSLLSKNLKIKIFRSIILSVVLCGYETWFLTKSGEHRLRVLENRVLRSIFRSKREEVAGGRRRLHNEDLHNLHASPNIIRVIKLACMGEMISDSIFVGKPEGKRPHGRPSCRWEDNIRMDHKEKVWALMDWIHLAKNKDHGWLL
jgi:hypothetical protein